MDPQEKYELLTSRILTNATFTYLKHPEGNEKTAPLDIWGPLLRCLSDQELEVIRDSHIYLSVMFSPASHSIIRTELPINAKVINVDYNHLSNLGQRERLAIVLHEYGHAFHPELVGDESEFVADDFAISHGYGDDLRQSLQRNIMEQPEIYDKPITRNRINRIQQ